MQILLSRMSGILVVSQRTGLPLCSSLPRDGGSPMRRKSLWAGRVWGFLERHQAAQGDSVDPENRDTRSQFPLSPLRS